MFNNSKLKLFISALKNDELYNKQYLLSKAERLLYLAKDEFGEETPDDSDVWGDP